MTHHRKPTNGFKPGNQEAKKADHSGRKLMTQQLIALLNEKFQGMRRVARPVKTKDGSVATGSDGKPITEVVWEKDGAPVNMSNMRKVLENLVFNATVLNDQAAINAIFDRVEGKPAQAIVAEDDKGNAIRATRFILEFDPAGKPPEHAPTYTPDLPSDAAKH